MKGTWLPAMAGALLLAILLGACTGTSTPKESAPVLTADQATARINQIIDEGLQGLTPAPKLLPVKADSDYGPCLDTDDDQRVSLSLTYRLDDIPRADRAAVYQHILDNWHAKGYTFTSEVRRDDIADARASTPDDYLVGIFPDGTGRPLIGATAPCLWPDGTPGNTYVDSYNYPVPSDTPGARLVVVPTKGSP